jgi:hypothetical protein
MHYPYLHKNYIVQLDKLTFKMLNPYCFKSYLQQVLNIYLSEKKTLKQKKQILQEQLNKNFMQFACLIISLLNDYDDYQVY